MLRAWREDSAAVSREAHPDCRAIAHPVGGNGVHLVLQPIEVRVRVTHGPTIIRLRADHVCCYDFVHHRTYDAQVYRTLNVLDEFTRESLAIRVRRKLSSIDVIDVLTDLFILRGIPAYVRSDNGPEFVAKAVRQWIAAVGARTAFIEPGSPWENGYIESFNARLPDELLNGGDLLHPQGSRDSHRSLAAPLQRHPPTRQPGIPAAGPGNDRRAKLAARLRYAPPAFQLGRKPSMH